MSPRVTSVDASWKRLTLAGSPGRRAQAGRTSSARVQTDIAQQNDGDDAQRPARTRRSAAWVACGHDALVTTGAGAWDDCDAPDPDVAGATAVAARRCGARRRCRTAPSARARRPPSPWPPGGARCAAAEVGPRAGRADWLVILELPVIVGRDDESRHRGPLLRHRARRGDGGRLRRGVVGRHAGAEMPARKRAVAVAAILIRVLSVMGPASARAEAAEGPVKKLLPAARRRSAA